jgi:hypothetical protein
MRKNCSMHGRQVSLGATTESNVCSASACLPRRTWRFPKDLRIRARPKESSDRSASQVPISARRSARGRSSRAMLFTASAMPMRTSRFRSSPSRSTSSSRAASSADRSWSMNAGSTFGAHREDVVQGSHCSPHLAMVLAVRILIRNSLPVSCARLEAERLSLMTTQEKRARPTSPGSRNPRTERLVGKVCSPEKILGLVEVEAPYAK